VTADLDLADLGIAEFATSTLPAEQVQRLGAALDLPRAPVSGDALPLLWHWAFFTPTVPTSALGRDGHPRLPATGATQGLPRRMFAGGRVRQLEPLLVGVPAQRRAHVVACEPKTGRSGRLLLVGVRYEIHQEGRPVLEEEQSLVYREEGVPVPLPLGEHQPSAPAGGWCEQKTVDRVTLFRFSAITFNSHRIHYDADYARRVEGYPGLVVHGPLVAMLLAGSADAHAGQLSSLAFRATSPLFEGLPFWIVGGSQDREITLTAVRNDGQPAMQATAHLG
jgi:hydroxyacyl-ACP dehydratase HTD2-like protein with hotdog domain